MSEPVRHHKAMLVTAFLVAGWTGLASAQVLGPTRQPARLPPSLVEPSGTEEFSSSLNDEQQAPTPEDQQTAHLASYYTEDDAMAGWLVLTNKFEDALAGLEPVLVDVDLGDRGVFVRLLAGPLPSWAEAEDLCYRLKDEGAYCVPADSAGRIAQPTDGFDG